ncbi:hypothetical protein [Bradyrhizobium sp. 2S1]|uniref:hypothetical protein n=1 Tax=Bradyrhizobium sp. 2S1 TaxID=1404429 RepID=UPI00140BA5FB|nr:hypothetical protein [Bradyrhizobium sp. 2S1]MCK7669668.1 hypothetical protein [Bradyrhizobium sp. 2S1]
MKIQITEAQVWWIVQPDEIRPVRGIDGPKMVSGLQSVFRFPSTPTEVQGGGAEFLNGRLSHKDQDILITKLAVFADGINVHVPTTTDDAEVVLQHALAFFFDLGVRRPTSEPVHFFQSIIVADFDSSLENIIPKSLLQKISKAMPIEGESQLFTFATNFDASLISNPRWRTVNPSLFRIERRAAASYDVNRYFCLANMKSSEHIEVLTEFEKFALTASK